ncbi:hypothetical protein VNI00_004245 [Paramarasmius palmivorus]|uniref:DUF6534 domain-containing protein n=1 Tax=Paramarasmius palmivorus TaxID=297713 RepID=A0AAW0DPK0_9AGAR
MTQLLGYMLNWGLYGVLSTQVYTYWIAFPDDGLLTQALVYGIYLLESAQTFSLTYDAFQHFAFSTFDSTSVYSSKNEWWNTLILDGVVALVFQVFFANRIRHLLSGKKVMPGIIVLLSIAQLVGAITQAVIIKGVVFTVNSSSTFAYIWLACATTGDILIAVTMIYAFSKYDTSFRETKCLVNRLRLLALETGGLIAITSLTSPILFYFFPERNYFLTPILVVSKLYSNSLLAILNARVRIYGERGSRDVRVNKGQGWKTSISITTNDPTFPRSSYQPKVNVPPGVQPSSPEVLASYRILTVNHPEGVKRKAP